MSQENCDEIGLEEAENWWDKDEILLADLETALSLEEFTSEFVGLLIKAAKENPDLRERIDKLCDFELYEDLVLLGHCRILVRGLDIEREMPESLEVDFIRLWRKVRRSYLDNSEYESYRGRYIAQELRGALGHDLFEPEEMCDRHTKEIILKDLRFMTERGLS